MTKKRILAVDDEVTLTPSLKLNLELGGSYEVQTENNSAHALEAARSFRPYLVLLDVMTPTLDGGDVAAQMRNDPLLKGTPVLFPTAIVSNSETDGREKQRGGETFLAKPVDIAVLRRSLTLILSP